jgi:hypothetical protein
MYLPAWPGVIGRSRVELQLKFEAPPRGVVEWPPGLEKGLPTLGFSACVERLGGRARGAGIVTIGGPKGGDWRYTRSPRKGCGPGAKDFGGAIALAIVVAERFRTEKRLGLWKRRE